MTAFPCKNCGTEITGIVVGLVDRCSPCNKKHVELQRRILSFCLIPIWLPLMLAALAVGMVWAVLCRGFRAGMICVKELSDAWSPDA